MDYNKEREKIRKKMEEESGNIARIEEDEQGNFILNLYSNEEDSKSNNILKNDVEEIKNYFTKLVKDKEGNYNIQLFPKNNKE